MDSQFITLPETRFVLTLTANKDLFAKYPKHRNVLIDSHMTLSTNASGEGEMLSKVGPDTRIIGRTTGDSPIEGISVTTLKSL